MRSGRCSSRTLRQPPDRLLDAVHRGDDTSGRESSCVTDGFVYLLGDEDAVLGRAALYSVCQVDRRTPHVVDDRGAADKATADLTGVDARAQTQVATGLGVESVDDALGLDGEIDGAADIVQPRHVEPAACQ